MLRKTLCCILIIVCLCASLVSCSDAIDVRSNENGFITDDTGIGYNWCGRAVFALSVGKVYAEDEKGGEYCEIQFEDPSRFLCDNDKELPYVYRADGVPEVTVDNFNPVAALLYLEGERSMLIDRFYASPEYLVTSDGNAEGTSDDSIYTYAIRDAMTKTDPVSNTTPSVDEMDTDYTVHIRLLSADYPGLYYEIVFWRDNNGTNYLYDTGTSLSYLCPYIVTERFWGEPQ